MRKPLLGTKAAILVSGGFCQDDLTQAQKALQDADCSVSIISPDIGVVNGWMGEEWGHHYAVDVPLNTALGVDYDFVVVPGGQRSIDKLKLTGHAKRFLGSFLESGRPIVMMGDSIKLLVYTDQIAGRRVAGPTQAEKEVAQAGGEWHGEDICFDNALMSGAIDADKRGAFVAMMVDHFKLSAQVSQAA